MKVEDKWYVIIPNKEVGTLIDFILEDECSEFDGNANFTACSLRESISKVKSSSVSYCYMVGENTEDEAEIKQFLAKNNVQFV